MAIIEGGVDVEMLQRQGSILVLNLPLIQRALNIQYEVIPRNSGG